MNFKLYSAVENYIKLNNITMKNFAKSLGITKSSLYNYLRKNADPSVTTAIKISKKLNRTVEELWE